MDHKTQKESAARTWLIILTLVLVILAKGALSFFVVKDLGQPDWDFGVIQDVPGQSPYAMYPLNNPQHVSGLKEEKVVSGGLGQP